MLLLLAFLLALIPANIASNRGYSALLWWLYGAALFPVAFIHSLLLERRGWSAEWAEISKGRCLCSECNEWVSERATRCSHCGVPFDEDASGAVGDPTGVGVLSDGEMPHAKLGG